MSDIARCRDCKQRFPSSAANLTARWVDGKDGRRGRWTYGQTCVRCIERSCAHLTPDTLSRGRESLLNRYAAHNLLESLNSMVGYRLTDLDDERWRPLFATESRTIDYDTFIDALHAGVDSFRVVAEVSEDDCANPELTAAT